MRWDNPSERKKQSKRLLGFYRKHPEVKLSISKKLKGRYVSLSTRKKMSLNNPMKRPEISKKVSEKLKGRKKPYMLDDKNPAKRPEVRKKISRKARLRWKDTSLRAYYSERISGNKNPTKRPEIRRKISDAAKRRYKNDPTKNPFYGRNGNKSPSWIHGKSREPYKLEFNFKLKELVRNRFGRKCMICLKPENGQRLTVHHIDYDKDNIDLNNLIPLHKSCHGLTISPENRILWQEYFKGIMGDLGL